MEQVGSNGIRRPPRAVENRGKQPNDFAIVNAEPACAVPSALPLAAAMLAVPRPREAMGESLCKRRPCDSGDGASPFVWGMAWSRDDPTGSPADDRQTRLPQHPAGSAGSPDRHHGPRAKAAGRLCLAEGGELAGRASRSQPPAGRYPGLPRRRERLLGGPDRPRFRPPVAIGRGDAGQDQGRRHQRAREGRPVRLLRPPSHRGAAPALSAAANEPAATPLSCWTGTRWPPASPSTIWADDAHPTTTSSWPGAATRRARSSTPYGSAT